EGQLALAVPELVARMHKTRRFRPRDLLAVALQHVGRREPALALRLVGVLAHTNLRLIAEQLERDLAGGSASDVELEARREHRLARGTEHGGAPSGMKAEEGFRASNLSQRTR